ncbi:hypothetical protein QZM89_07490 [Burkholderia gladioli]|uniref:hypothetical protein n=1 Tax=Burkholderia gladioli TaxID=28095 RepID=UPI0026555DFD|nr:hypothetical protein [Burkholderia gladioli]MDN7495025.1 hypothetical protein [Burkholderia gladioli]
MITTKPYSQSYTDWLEVRCLTREYRTLQRSDFNEPFWRGKGSPVGYLSKQYMKRPPFWSRYDDADNQDFGGAIAWACSQAAKAMPSM